MARSKKQSTGTENVLAGGLRKSAAVDDHSSRLRRNIGVRNVNDKETRKMTRKQSARSIAYALLSELETLTSRVLKNSGGPEWEYEVAGTIPVMQELLTRIAAQASEAQK